MYKKITLSGLAFALIAFSSCKPPANSDDNEAPVPAGMVRINLTKSGIPATIDIPDTTKKINGVEALSSGAIRVYDGNGFNLLINLSGEAIAMKKNDINGDDLNKPKDWVVNDSNDLVYSTQKDTNAFANAKPEYHLYAIIKKGTNSYYVEDQSQGADGNVHTFGKEQVQTMLTSAKSITYLKPPVKNPS
jgi:hypothetical protein